jgi:amino acid adenylation domain-containing protein
VSSHPTEQSSATDATDLLRRLDDLGIDLSWDGLKVRYRSPDRPVPADLLAAMKAHRDELADLVGQRSRLPGRPVHDGADRTAGGPLTRSQQSVWATDFFRTDGSYNLWGALRFRGRLDTDALAAAVTDLQLRHSSLRTVFRTHHGQPRQHILADARPLARRDLGGEASALDTCLAECACQAGRRIPLDSEPPVRMTLYRLADDDHVFSVVLHHVLADKESFGILLDDLAHCYSVRRAGRDPGPTPLKLDMVDYARWEQEVLRLADTSAQRRYWQERLADAAPGPLPLPPPTAEPDGRARLTSLVLDPGTTATVRRLAADSRSSVFTVVSAGIATVLQRYTGRDDLVVGMPVARRDRRELAGLVGLLVDMVPVRLDLTGAPAFRELIRRTRSAVLGAVANGLPHEETAPRYNVVLTDAGTDRPAPVFDGVDVSRPDIAQATDKYDLNFLVHERDDRVVIDVESAAQAVAERDVRGMLALLRRIITQAADPSRCAADLAAAPWAEAATGAVGAPANWVPGAEESLAARFSAMAAQRGEAHAITDDGVDVSYADLHRLVVRIARGLRRHGAGPGDIVAVRLPRGSHLIATMLGVMAAGAACLVLDDTWPEPRVRDVLADAGARLVIGDGSARTREHLSVADLTRLGAEPLPLPDIPSAGVAYVIYTSGSTGRPKGVHVTHRNLLSLLDATAPAFGFGPEDTWTQFHSCAFDFAMWEVFGCLLHGGRLIVVPKWATREPEVFANLLRRERVTVLNQTPSVLAAMLPVLARPDQDAPPLRHVIFGGEALPRDLVQRWYAHMGSGTRLVNMYGITETTVHASWRWLGPEEWLPAESDIGEPLPGTSLHILHENGSPALDRCVGEICVGGPQVSVGYPGRPRETALRFVPDPYSDVPGARMYRSGDFGRRNPSGLAYLGRRDGQVQIRGFRVELPEIERALVRQPGVTAAAAAVATRDGGPRVVAAVVADAGLDRSPGELRAAVRGVLPEYMVPHVVYRLDALPLTVNGKLDRAAVAAAAPQGSGADRPGTVPRTTAEALLLELARQALDADAVLGADFFGLGGDSMRAIRLVGLARERGLTFTVRDVYEAADLAELAARAQSGSGPAARVPFDGVTGDFPPDVVDAYPMTALQTGMIYHQELAPDSGVYHIVLSYRVGGAMQPAAFRSAVEWLMERHPVLRTSFDLADPRGSMQRVHAEVPAPVAFHDLTGLPGDEQRRRIAAAVEAEQRTGFDLGRPGLFRLVALTTSPDDYQLVFSHHHAILDGWSVNLFFQDLHERYQHLLAGDTADGPAPLRTAFADYVTLEQRAAQDADQRAFWQAQVPADAALLAPRRSAPPVMRQLRAQLPEGTIDRLSGVARQAGVPLKAVLLAAHVVVMSWLLGRDEVVTGLTTACRPEQADADRILGLFLNELPLRIRLGNQTWAQLARQVHAAELAMLPHRWYPHALIQQERGSGPLLDVNFNFTDFHTTKALVRSGRLEVLGIHEMESTHYPLGINYTVDVRTRELRFVVEYDAAALTQRTAELTVAAHRAALAALVEAPDATCRATVLPGVAEEVDSAAVVAEPPIARPAAPEPARADPAVPAPGLLGTALRQSVREVWREVLGAGAYPDGQSFFEAGGSSLTAMQVVSRLRARHGALPMSAFMNAPTIAGIAAALSGRQDGDGTGPAAPSGVPLPGSAPADPGGTEADGPRRYPLLPGQHQLWRIATQLPELPLFGMPTALRIEGPLDLDLLQRAVHRTQTRHQALRTRITAEGEQEVEAGAELPIGYVDLRDRDDPVAACERAMVAEARQPLALDRAPLLRMTVYRIAESSHVLFLNVHHIVCDGWSMGVLLTELIEACQEPAAGTVPDRSGPLGSGELALARKNWRDSPEAARQRAYWTRRLAGPWPSLMDAPGGRLRRAADPAPSERFRLASCHDRLPADAADALREAARTHDLTEFMVLVTGLAATLRRWSGRRDIRIGTLVANRTWPGSDTTVGLLTNTVVLRLDVEEDPDHAELSWQARQVCVEAYDHQELPFEDVLPLLPGDAGPTGRLFEVMLVLQEEPGGARSAGGLAIEPYRARGGALGTPLAPTAADLVLSVTPTDGDLHFTLLHQPSATPPADARLLLADVLAAVRETARALGRS